MRDHSTSRSRGFGFISFDTEQAVDDLLSRGNRLELAGAQVSRVLTKMNIYFSFLYVLKDNVPTQWGWPSGPALGLRVLVLGSTRCAP